MDLSDVFRIRIPFVVPMDEEVLSAHLSRISTHWSLLRQAHGSIQDEVLKTCRRTAGNAPPRLGAEADSAGLKAAASAFLDAHHPAGLRAER